MKGRSFVAYITEVVDDSIFIDTPHAYFENATKRRGIKSAKFMLNSCGEFPDIVKLVGKKVIVEVQEEKAVGPGRQPRTARRNQKRAL